MDRFQTSSIRFRLLGTLGLLLLLLISSLAIAALRVNTMRTALDEINQVNSVKQRQAINFRGSVHDRSILVRDLARFESPEDINRSIDEIRGLEADYDTARVALDELKAAHPDPDEEAPYARINEIEAATNPLVETMIAKSAAGEIDAEFQAALDASRPLFTDWLGAINVYIDLQEEKNQALGDQVTGIAGSFTILVIALAAVALAIGGVAAYLIVRLIVRRITAIDEGMSAVTADDETTDLTVRLDEDTGDEFGQVAVACNRVLEKLAETVGSVAEASHEVNASSNEVAERAEAISGGIQRQLDQTMQVSAAVEQMSVSIGQIADSGSQAAEASRRSESNAKEGGDVVRRVVQQMESIAQHVRESGVQVEDLGAKGQNIESVIAVINDIAEQTNMLALNATIEAARAGEHGRGFAVVAEEVRQLAERTTQATQEVADSIREIQDGTQAAGDRMQASNDGVETGVELVSNAGSTLEGIVSESASVLDMTEAMAQMTDQQAAASGEVAASVSQIEALCSEAADSASGVSEASARLSDRASQLDHLVKQFRFDGARDRVPTA